MSSKSASLSDDTNTFAARLRVTLLFMVAISSVGMRRDDKVQCKQITKTIKTKYDVQFMQAAFLLISSTNENFFIFKTVNSQTSVW